MLEEAGVPCAPVNNLEELMQEEQVHAIGTLIEVEDEDRRKLRLSGLPFLRDGNGAPPPKRPPALGEHNDYVYRELLGVSDEEYERLKADGHIAMDFDPSIA